MKIISLIIVGLQTISMILTQETINLTDEQLKDYNRNKLTVILVSDLSKTKGHQWNIFSNPVNSWQVIKGMDDPISAEEFFRLTGYSKEADSVKYKQEDANQKITAGVILSIAGLIISLTPKTEEKDYLIIKMEETVYPYMVPGMLLSLFGVFLVDEGKLLKSAPVAPYQTAVKIAEEYNRKLLSEITR